ncbi:unnamed protein product [Rotaria sp. Silwood1]|nr:unnamed protein product [Rotaria sp. Silwood1]CAF3439090.1 unnamed protein product [Rotaria sp. Silwood1]CAF3461293.1 unnamed protein product [Rotaria sp. Silwood1]CAF3466652.1 unnamed protein product [Rotaria sp. Silwood1]CAF3523546.1 unnamed protein product [Rotaria sp. Silwood1]
MFSSQTAIVVGLGGITNGGKTTMCDFLERLFSSNKYNLDVKSLHIDDYFRSNDDSNHIHLDKYNYHDWDCLNALDIDRFMKDFQSICLQCDLLLVEGFLIFNIVSPSKDDYLYDLAYHFDLPYEECRKRRFERIYDPPEPEGYFDGHVWNAYIKAKKEAFEQNKNIRLEIIDTSKESFEKIQEKIIKDIEIALKLCSKQNDIK